MTGLQFRMLNTKKRVRPFGPNQCDKKHQFRLKWVCEREPNLDVNRPKFQDSAQRSRRLRRGDHIGRAISRESDRHDRVSRFDAYWVDQQAGDARGIGSDGSFGVTEVRG
jgi:hypothetical protein